MRELAKVVSLFLILTGLAGCGSSTDENDEKIINDAINKSLGRQMSEKENKVVPDDYPLVKTLSIYPSSGRPEDKKVVNIALIGKLTEVTELNLGANNISDLSPLAGLNKLTLLDISLNKVADLKPLVGKNNLTVFNAHGNEIKDISPLAGMTKLEVVYLSNNQISDITPLLQLKSLKDLTLKSNKVTAVDIANLKKSLPKGCGFQHD
jgi:Leucine-rich repeat (LRR) protein